MYCWPGKKLFRIFCFSSSLLFLKLVFFFFEYKWISSILAVACYSDFHHKSRSSLQREIRVIRNKLKVMIFDWNGLLKVILPLTLWIKRKLAVGDKNVVFHWIQEKQHDVWTQHFSHSAGWPWGIIPLTKRLKEKNGEIVYSEMYLPQTHTGKSVPIVGGCSQIDTMVI